MSFPASLRYPVAGGLALDLTAATLTTSYQFTDWFAVGDWPVCVGQFQIDFDAAASGVTSYEIKAQAKCGAGTAFDLRTTLAGTTSTAVEHAITDVGAAHNFGALLQTTDQAGADQVRFGIKITGAGAAGDDAATCIAVKVMWS